MVDNAKKKVLWTKNAENSLENIYKEIQANSPQNAALVKRTILEKTQKLSLFPNQYPTDRFRKNNSGSIRAFETHSHRIVYRVDEKAVVILRVRYAGKEPEFI
mgnify:CR=1 FL=1